MLDLGRRGCTYVRSGEEEGRAPMLDLGRRSQGRHLWGVWGEGEAPMTDMGMRGGW